MIFNSELKRFIIIGISTVLIDFIFYTIFINCSIKLSIAKAISFLIGAFYAYLMNQKWTFRSKGGLMVFLKFIFVYLISLKLNILINKIVINNLGIKNIKTIIFAFITSTIFSALFNFLLISKFVFKKYVLKKENF